MFLAIQLVVAGAIYLALGEAGLEKAAVSRLAAAAAPFLAFPIVYAWKFAAAVPALAAESAAVIAELRGRLDRTPVPPSRDLWIDPHQAWRLAAARRGLAVEDDAATAAATVFADLRQYASDGELAVRGRPLWPGDAVAVSPRKPVPTTHWDRHDFDGSAYVGTDAATIRAASTILCGPSSGDNGVRYCDLVLRRTDIERLFPPSAATAKESTFERCP
ncbi:hypothetical protein [Enhydrobacter aerosaccus]|uniref:hypothetical protein n=1 Tax=Enhydrobacter aerosaccus TaxID=225324 RepID=UPI001115F4EF|nr:hypothetical protein [Enhydrobacter aerosaccus]